LTLKVRWPIGLLLTLRRPGAFRPEAFGPPINRNASFFRAGVTQPDRKLIELLSVC